MKLRLILKQSWKDYKNKSILYFVFIIFLTIILGVVIGILSFISYSRLNISDAHATRYAGQIYLNNGVVSEKYDGIKPLEKRAVYDKNGKLKEYIINNIQEETKNDLKSDINSIVNIYIDFLGQYFNGDLKEFKNNTNQSLNQEELEAKMNIILNGYKNINIDNKDLINFCIQINKDLYKNLPLVSSQLMLIYFYDNFKNDFDLWSHPIKWDIKDDNNNYITTSLAPSYIDNYETFEKFNEHPEFHSNKASNFKIYNEIKTESLSPEEKKMVYEGKFIYVNPRYLEVNNYELGDKINIFIDDISYSMLIKGTIMTPLTTTMNSNQGRFVISPEAYYNLFGKKGLNYENKKDLRLDNQRILFTQKYNSTKKSNLEIINRMNEDFQFSAEYDNEGLLLQNKLNTIWTDSLKDDTYFITINLLNKIMYVIIFGLLVIIFVVFYFMCENFLRLQRDDFYNLKAMGNNNFVLTLLASFSAVIPIAVSLIFSLFISVPISNMFANSVSSSYSFTWPPILFTWNLVIYVIAIISIIFSIFMFNNFIVLSGKKSKISKFKETKKPSKFIINTKKMLTPLPSRTRIGFSFALSNIAKNIYCLIILSLAFTVILFTFQFNVSVNNSASSMISFAYPDISIKYQSNYWDFQSIYEKETDSNDVIKKYKYSSEQINSYEELEKYIKVTNSESFIEMLVDTSFDIQSFNNYNKEKNDISNYIITGDFIFWLANSIPNQESLSLIINNLVIPKILANTAISETDKEKAINWLKDQNNQDLIWEYYKLFKDKVNSMKSDLDKLELNETSKFPVNVLFGKTVVIPSKKSYWSSGVSFSNISDGNEWGSATSVSASRRQKQDSFGTETELFSSSEYKSTITKVKMENGVDAPALKVEVAKPLADRYRMRVGDSMLMSVNSLKTNEISEVRIPISIAAIKTNDLLTQNIYFEKTDYFEVLKETIQNRAVPLKDFDPAWTSYMKLIDEIIEKSNSVYNNESFILNNAQFSTEDIPVNLKYLTLPKISNLVVKDNLLPVKTDLENENRTDLLSYWDKIESPSEFWNSKNGKYINSLSSDLWNYRLIKEAILLKAKPFQNIMRILDQVLVGMVLAISLVLISLILLENKNTIVLFKSLGYKTREINKYLVTGYLLAATWAIIIALILNKYIIAYLSPIVYQSVGISLIYVLSYSYILYGVILTTTFIFLILSSIKIYTKRQNPKDVIK
ncbi:ABC transporter permease [Mesoplasma tabanidae]|uniref:ABC transporter permease n=1 Tax=Mesoplasma tabanidae TaxID=219745 RepID=A0A2K8P3L0_9MOLU|nr:ABC transporter permease [Mesoplasma tabanidae]ATZ21276.1 hypothetical protein MTABA_v1c00700 [Mesoplasma tabanidae]